jgi:hypothetical protein
MFCCGHRGSVAVTLLFLLKPSPDRNFGVDAPVVMLELPESFLISTAPPTDLAPGPKQEERLLQRKKTEPPEQPADVALPKPPKPEPPQEQKRATAPTAAAPPLGVLGCPYSGIDSDHGSAPRGSGIALEKVREVLYSAPAARSSAAAAMAMRRKLITTSFACAPAHTALDQGAGHRGVFHR